MKVDLPNQSKVQQQLLLLLQAHNSLIDIAIFRFEGLSLYELFDRHFHISSEQMEILTKDGMSKWKHRIRSAKWRLRQLGLVSSRSKGIWELTAGGLAASMLLGGSVIEKHLEGKLVSRVMRSYERSAYLRNMCLKRHGYRCKVCEVLLSDKYGPTVSKLVHVHHRNPLGVVKQSHKVDPKRDLIPVCPNCHAVIHFDGILRSVEEVKAMITDARLS